MAQAFRGARGARANVTTPTPVANKQSKPPSRSAARRHRAQKRVEDASHAAANRSAAAANRSAAAAATSRTSDPMSKKGGRTTGARSAPKGPSQSLAQSYVTRMYGTQAYMNQRSTVIKFLLGSWWVESPRSDLTSLARRGAKKFDARLQTCRRLRDSMVDAWENSTSTLAACQAGPQACSLCQYHDDVRFKLAVRSSAAMRRQTDGTFRTLFRCAALGCILAVLLHFLCARAGQQTTVPHSTADQWRATPINYAAVFWSRGRGFAFPVATLKLVVLILLGVDMLGIGAPELNIVAVPELIAHVRRHPVIPKDILPGMVANLTGIFMPDLDDSTADVHAARLARVRDVLFVSWGLFLLLPLPRFRWVGSACYVLGAASYVSLGSLGLTYNLAHSTQSSILFVMASTFAVFDLADNPRAGVWHRQFLVLCVIAPVYLFSGISKLRYIGLDRQLSGSWMIEDIVLASCSMHVRASVPMLNDVLLHLPFGLKLMSWGNLALEFFAPLGLLLSPAFSWAELIFHASVCVLAVSFHSMVFLQMGPNFVRHSMLVLVSADPLSLFLPWASHRPPSDSSEWEPPRQADRVRGAVATGIMAAWLYVQIHSDASHYFGFTPREKKLESYWPIPEMSMFAKPSADTGFRLTGCINVFLLVALSLRIWCSGVATFVRQAGAVRGG